ncbi:hypothetical protein HL658_24495 [Azospirillum sp. RWY-5-1]|uniref:Energy transducer TonB n=1 Tax=Azospirillum oleiclasticum TaxID=2735135 RepID=A0ABX2TFP4_9PROT|nr:hypothetical protein [Azospirillum oleiclasticum]NYZ15713.1 hypothetical protein [Azospirillum oleiclasticum]NYZ21983.1 hypothetical protein [Azospirillum oleiclasticum]
MNGKHALIWLGLAAVAGAVLFETSYEVQEMEEQLASLNRQIVHEQEAIQVLRAEWSFLNDPTRLENLARSHTDLRPAEARQFLALDVVPFRPTPMVTEPLPAAPAPHSIPNVASQPKPGRVPPSAVPTLASTGGGAPAVLTPAVITAPAAAPAGVGRETGATVAVAKPPAAVKPSQGARPSPSRPAETMPARVAGGGATRSTPTIPVANDAMGVLIARLGGNQ